MSFSALSQELRKILRRLFGKGCGYREETKNSAANKILRVMPNGERIVYEPLLGTRSRQITPEPPRKPRSHYSKSKVKSAEPTTQASTQPEEFLDDVPEPIEFVVSAKDRMIATMEPADEYQLLDLGSCGFFIEIEFSGSRLWCCPDYVSGYGASFRFGISSKEASCFGLLSAFVTEGLALTEAFGVIKIRPRPCEGPQGHYFDYGYEYSVTPRQLALMTAYCEKLYDGKSGEYHARRGNWNRAVQLAPERAEFQFGLAKTTNNTRLALASFSLAIRLRPGMAYYFFARGNLHFRLGLFRKAIADYSEALRLEPAGFEMYLSRAQAYKCLGDEEAANKDYSQFQIDDPYSEWNR